MTKTRVALFAGQDLGFVMADYFSRRDDIELFIVSFQSRRDVIYQYRTALTIARERGLPFVETTKPYEETHAILRPWAPDVIVCAYYARLFSAELLAIPRLGALNVHPGKFPRYQGPMPTPWYILNGEDTFGVGIFQVDEGIDTGPVFVQREYPIAPDETGHGLYRRTMTAAAELYIENFDRIVSGELVATPQQGESFFCPRIEPRCHIDWTWSREVITRRIRVHAKPYLPAFAFLFNRLIAINRATALETVDRGSARPGRIAQVLDDGRFTVECGDGLLRIDEHDVCPPLIADEWQRHAVVGARLS